MISAKTGTLYYICIFRPGRNFGAVNRDMSRFSGTSGHPTLDQYIICLKTFMIANDYNHAYMFNHSFKQIGHKESKLE